jgi:signal transduction histidine kinase
MQTSGPSGRVEVEMAIPPWWSAVTSTTMRMLRLLASSREDGRRQVSEIARTVEMLTEQQNLLEQLLDEQAALRRVATLVAQGVAPSDILTCVAEEIARFLHVDTGLVIRFESDATATVVAKAGPAAFPGTAFPGTAFHGEVNSNWRLEEDGVAARVWRTGRPTWVDEGAFSSVGTPIVIGDRLWGVAVAMARLPTDSAVSTVRPENTVRPGKLPADAEERLAHLADLIATAISNADARAQLTASRSRVVAAADDTRRRIERELHNGIQQRLVSLALVLRTAATAPAALPELQTQLAEVESSVTGIIDELREMTRGIHPAILSVGGLRPALKALARRSAVAVELDVRVDRRMPERVEFAAYYVVSEALTNAVEHANTSVVRVHVDLADGLLRLSVDDDGVGGADFGRGSGLIGLEDRVEAVGGKIKIISPPGRGTLLQVTIPTELP